MDNHLNSLNSNNSEKKLSKSQIFVENTKKAVRKVLTTAWIAVSSMWPVTTPTVVPASVNTITAVTPLASTAVKTIWLWTAASLLAACSWEEWPSWSDGPIDTKDNIAPTINVNKSEVDITWWKQIRIDWNKLYIWDVLVASRSDNKTKNCNVTLSINWKSISSWTTISEEWTLTIKVSDEAGNVKNADVKLNVTAEQDISWLENIKLLDMQVDQEINLLEWVTFGNGAQLVKTEIELEWQKTEISDPNHYIPSYPWTCSIILTIKDKDGNTTEYKVDNLIIKPLDYMAMEVTNIKPVDILPIIWQIEAGDKNAYDHIEHLRIAEATRIRDMMWKYGAGNHSAEEYQQLMMRLNTGMMGENPLWYDNYEAVWWMPVEEPSNHAHAERFTLNALINHANFKVINSPSVSHYEVLYSLCKQDPNKINIMWISIGSDVDKATYDSRDTETMKKYLKEKNVIIFWAWWNIRTNRNWILMNKLYQENYNLPDNHSVYTWLSTSHDKNDDILNRHIMITFGTNKDGDIDQTNEEAESSKFPVWFHNKVLFAWRTFPFRTDPSGKIEAFTWKYATSHTNYVNVAIADLCFQMKADVADVDELLEMIRLTSLIDHIRFNWEDQPLQLMNPAWFFKTYLMPNTLPNNLKSEQTVQLNKWYYKWVIFDIPWAEVKIEWQWVAYNEVNKSLIKSQNPMTLEWRINWDLCKKMWYKWKSISWKVIAVDDSWNWLNIEKEFSISVQ